MDNYMQLGKLNVVANVYYSNVTNEYSIGLHIGNVYTILSEKFETKELAMQYVLENL